MALERKVPLVQPVHKDRRALLEQPARKAIKEKPVHKDRKAIKV